MSDYNKVSPEGPATLRENFRPNPSDIKYSKSVLKYNSKKNVWNNRLFILTNTHIAFY